MKCFYFNDSRMQQVFLDSNELFTRLLWYKHKAKLRTTDFRPHLLLAVSI